MVFLFACNNDKNKTDDAADKASKFIMGTFGHDLEFLKEYHKDLVILGDENAQVVIAPAYQGRVMTSTAEGHKGASFGWINHKLIASKQPSEHMNAVGGEERFWLGPEGGQFPFILKRE